MLNKIATIFGVIIAIAIGIFIAPYFNKFTDDSSQDNIELTSNTLSDQSTQEQHYSIPVNDSPPDEKVEIRRDVVTNILGGQYYQWTVKNISDQPIEILNVKINNREDCILVFKKYVGKVFDPDNKNKGEVKFHEKGVELDSMFPESMRVKKGDILGYFSDEFIENSGSRLFQVGYSFNMSYPERCGEPVIIKTETSFQIIETRF